MVEEERNGPDQMEAPATPTEPTGESRVGRWFQRGLRWVVAIGVVFLVGVLVAYFTRVRPQTDTIKSLEANLRSAQSQVGSLQADLEELQPLEDENEALRQDLATRQQHLQLLAVLVDVTRAQLALAQDQPGAASNELSATDSRLAALQDELDGPSAEAVGSMRDRLQLVLAELEGDSFAAERDLEILANNLVDLERQWFGQDSG